MYSCGPPHMDVQEWDDQHEPTYSSCVRTRDVTLKTCRRRWMIGRNGERRSGISTQAARHDDDDDDFCLCVQILRLTCISKNLIFKQEYLGIMKVFLSFTDPYCNSYFKLRFKNYDSILLIIPLLHISDNSVLQIYCFQKSRYKYWDSGNFHPLF